MIDLFIIIFFSNTYITVLDNNKPYGENVTSSKHAASMQQASCRQAASSNSLLAMAYFK